MDDRQVDKLTISINRHADVLGDNLVNLKNFLAGQQREQQEFPAEQRRASDRAQTKAQVAAVCSAIAAIAAAIATALQAYDAFLTPKDQIFESGSRRHTTQMRNGTGSLQLSSPGTATQS